ncbi:hypothetical protein LPJ78_004830 [Coemansia sp. RSA 989]|nr:hypothetical protein LPJ78_004830 [Coemansia sp. RSA 989]KAJ2669198.1 hypothetical protein IWW42_004740 [Coemansia sp. RSA 1085]
MPFGTLYSEADGRIGLLALYSSTVVFSDDKCSSSNRWLSYYTYIDKVIGFVAYVLKRPVKYTNSTGLYEEQPLGIDKYISNQPASINYSGKTLIGGDIFAARDEFYEPLIEPTSEFWSAPQETSSLDFESSLDTSLDDSSNSSGLSRNQILAIAITIPLVLVCTATAVVLFYCRRVKSKRSRNQNDDDEDNWDPYAERLNIRELANEIRGIDDPIPPPTYNEVMRPSSIPLPGTSIETQTVRSSSIKKMQDVNKA